MRAARMTGGIGRASLFACLTLLALCQPGWATAPEPGAWIYDECPLTGGVLVDPARWAQGDEGLADMVRGIDQIIEADRCQSLYVYLFSDGHTLCPVPDAPFPSLDPEGDLAALGEWVEARREHGVEVYGVLDLLGWHRAGATLPSPFEGELAAIREEPIPGAPPVEGEYPLIVDDRTWAPLRDLVTFFASEEVGLDGLVFQLELPTTTMLGGSSDTLGLYQQQTGQPIEAIAAPIAGGDEGAVNRFAAWRDQRIQEHVNSLFWALAERPDLKLGLTGHAGYWSMASGARMNSAAAWPRWLRSGPLSTVLFFGRWEDADEDAGIGYSLTRDGMLKEGTAASGRPVLDAPSEQTLALVEAGMAPTDQLVANFVPGASALEWQTWIRSLPEVWPGCSVPPTVLPEAMMLQAVHGETDAEAEAPGAPDLDLAGATAEEAFAEVNKRLEAMGLESRAVLDPMFLSELTFRSVTVEVSSDGPNVFVQFGEVLRAITGRVVRSGPELHVVQLPDPARLMGDRHQQLGQWDAAIEQYEDCIARGVDLMAAYRGLGDTKRKEWDPHGALEAYDIAYTIGLRDPEFLMEAGNCFRDIGQDQQAETFLLQALEACPPENVWVGSWARVAIGRIYEAKADLAEALIWFEEAAATWEGNEWAHYWVAVAKLGLGDREGAAASARRALEIHPGMTEAESILGRAVGDDPQ